jgi:hypothetical protein
MSGNVLQLLCCIEVVEQNRSDALLLENFGFIFTSDERGDFAV